MALKAAVCTLLLCLEAGLSFRVPVSSRAHRIPHGRPVVVTREGRSRRPLIATVRATLETEDEGAAAEGGSGVSVGDYDEKWSKLPETKEEVSLCLW